MIGTEPLPPAPSRVARLLAGRLGDHRPAFTDGATGATRSWDDIATTAACWGRGARPCPGSRVGLLCSDPTEMAAALLAGLALGVTVAPLDPSAPGEETAGRVRTLGLGSVVVGPDDLDGAGAALDGTDVGVWRVGDGRLEAVRHRGGAGGMPGWGASLVLASSGTTGHPKLIPLRESQLLGAATAVVAAHGLTPHDRGYCPLPLSHINGVVVGVLSTLVGGTSLVLERRFSATSFWDTVGREQVTWLNLVPAILGVLAGRDGPDPAVAARVGFARSASAPLPAATRDRFEDLTGIPVVETYGMTEAASQITANPRPPGERRPGSVGRPLGVAVRVVGPGRRPLPPGATGEIEIGGARVVSEYWGAAGAPEARRTARATDGWLPTGDLGRLDGDGYLWVLGRVDDVINRGGEKLHPRLLEEFILRDPDVAAAVVVGRPHPILGEEPVAFIQPVAGRDPGVLLTRLTERCRTALGRSRCPAGFLIADPLPTGPNGKVRRAALRRAPGSWPSAAPRAVGPR